MFRNKKKTTKEYHRILSRDGFLAKQGLAISSCSWRSINIFRSIADPYMADSRNEMCVFLWPASWMTKNTLPTIPGVDC